MIRAWLPSLVTGARLVLIVPLCAALAAYDRPQALGLLLLAALSDLADGWLARRLKACTTFGAYFDAAADFALVAASYGVLVARGVYPGWLLLLIGAMFAQFVLTSRRQRPIYDPIGRYYGAALYASVFALVLVPDLLLSYALLLALVVLSTASLTSRAAALARIDKREWSVRTWPGEPT